MRLLVLQHHPHEHLGVFQDFLAADGIDWETVELDHGDPLPTLNGYAAIWVLSGPMAAWQETRFPWLAPEKRLLHEAVRDRELPVFGIGLGQQLLAEAAGGTSRALEHPFVGLDQITLTAAGRNDPVFAAVDPTLTALRWHATHLASLPDDATLLATASDGTVQAIAIGTHARGIQFHVEATPGMVAEWARITNDSAMPADALDEATLFDVRANLAVHRHSLQATARSIYDGFMRPLLT